MTSLATCPVCAGATSFYGRTLVLGKYEAEYERCVECGLIRSREAVWLDEAYSSAITALDLGLLGRCELMADIVLVLVSAERLRRGTFLDWAGGYGALTRMLRDRGLDFRHHDPYCTNLFASGFEGGLTCKYDLVTAVEVVEHLVDPVAALAPLARATDMLLLTTELIPSPPPRLDDWWYFAPETGQHILFLTAASLSALATALGYTATSLSNSLHVFHRRPLRHGTRVLLRRTRLTVAMAQAMRLMHPHRTLLETDYRFTLEGLRVADPRPSQVTAPTDDSGIR